MTDDPDPATPPAAQRSGWLRAALGLLLALPCALAAAPVPPTLLTHYAGEYSARCKDPTSLRARISAEGLTLRRGKKSVTAEFEAEALSYFGKNPPPDFAVALIGQVKDVGGITFVMFSSKGGPLIDLDADPAVLKRVGIAHRGTVKYRRCAARR